MAEILALSEFVQKVQKVRDPVPPEGAEILFFIGIRYERHVDPPEQPARKTRRKPAGRSPSTRSRKTRSA